MRKEDVHQKSLFSYKRRQKWLTRQVSYCLWWKCSVVFTQGDKKDKIQHTREDRAGTRKPGCSIASPRRWMNAPSHHSPDFFSRTGIIALYSFKLMLLGFGCLRSKTILTDPLSSKWGNKKKNLKSLLNYSAPLCRQTKTFNYVSRQFWASHVCVFLLLSLGSVI